MPVAPVEASIVAWLRRQHEPATAMAIRAGVGSDVSETFRALAVLVVRGEVERDGPSFRLAEQEELAMWPVAREAAWLSERWAGQDLVAEIELIDSFAARH